jgi:ankyrin repeat protein
MVRLLASRGALVDARDKKGRTTLSHAVNNGHPEMVKFLLEQKIVAKNLAKEGPALMRRLASTVHAPYYGQPDEGSVNSLAVIRMLQSHGIALDLFTAIAVDDVPRVTQLLKGDPALAKSKGALQRAVRLGRKEIAIKLLDSGADVNAIDADGETALHSACDEEEIAALLLRRGANVIAATKGYTPLHAAAQFGSVGVARMLLRAGAELNAKDDNGRTPLAYAAQRHRFSPELVASLRENGGRR